MFLHLLLALSLAITPTLRLPGHFFVAYDFKLRATVTVPVDRENREVGVQYASENEEGYTSRQLDEYVDWTTHNFEIRLRPGTYQIRAVLKQTAGKVSYSTVQTVQVLSNRPQDGE